MRSMSNNELHLFVFEGARAESKYVDKLEQHFLGKETQNTIFAKQLKKHISHKCPEVAVLSAFPVYVLDYYGVEGVKKKLEES